MTSVSNKESDKPTWLSIRDLADFYVVPELTVRYWLKSKKLNQSNRAHRIGGRWRINRLEFETKFIDMKRPKGSEARTKKPAQAPRAFDLSDLAGDTAPADPIGLH